MTILSGGRPSGGADFRRWDAKLHAFAEHCDPSIQPLSHSGPLSGATVGVKDIIDVAGVPTRNGSKACEHAAPAAQDADVVARLRVAGASVVGKTTTTEFAFTDPTDCRNPHDLARSPGGSSSGSGAAVAAGMIDVALGTQTAGSLCRPAAYCGAVGLKPTYGSFPMHGVTPLAPSFDTVGIIARTVEMAERAFTVMCPDDATSSAKAPDDCSFSAFLLDTVTPANPEVMAAYREATGIMTRMCADTVSPKIDLNIADIVADHRIVMNHEAAEAHGHLLDNPALLRPRFRAGLQAGLCISFEQALAAKTRLTQACAAFWESVSAVDVMLTLPVPDGAPLIDGTTGFQDWLTPWTVFGGPLVSLPWGLDSLGRPRAVMLAAHPGCEASLLAVARALEAQAPTLPRPVLPGQGSVA